MGDLRVNYVFPPKFQRMVLLEWLNTEA